MVSYTYRYRLMLKCWEANVVNRVCFKEIVAELTSEASEVYITENSANNLISAM